TSSARVSSSRVESSSCRSRVSVQFSVSVESSETASPKPGIQCEPRRASSEQRKAIMRNVKVFLVLLVAAAPVALSADWPMWGGTPSRNMVSTLTGMPTEWDVKTGKNVKWVADLGSQSYGNPSVGAGVVIIGTNNEAVRDPKQPGDRGAAMAFRESTGSV